MTRERWIIPARTATRLRRRTVNGTAATVSGTVQCEPGNAFVAVRLRQVKGPSITEGFNEIDFVCDGTVQPWSFVIQTPLGAKWKTGKATLGAFAEDADNFIEIQTTVRLTKG